MQLRRARKKEIVETNVKKQFNRTKFFRSAIVCPRSCSGNKNTPNTGVRKHYEINCPHFVSSDCGVICLCRGVLLYTSQKWETKKASQLLQEYFTNFFFLLDDQKSQEGRERIFLNC